MRNCFWKVENNWSVGLLSASKSRRLLLLPIYSITLKFLKSELHHNFSFLQIYFIH